MIELKQVSKAFHPGQVNEVRALRDIDLQVKAGTFLVLIGANGSGKTTLLNIIAGSIQASKGTIQIRNEDVTQLPDYKRSRWIARVFQDPLGGTASELSVLDNFRLAALRTRPKTLRIGIDRSFKTRVRDKIAGLGMGLENKLQQPMGTLSGGQRQALTLLMSVMDHTDILLLDEPTAALDPRSAEVVMQTAENLIRDYQLTTIFITHNLQETLRFGNRLIQMEHGMIRRDLDNQAKARLQLQDIYQWFD
ncbi:MAG: ATP-binding cassette domain-containing protein [Bacteroidetes bacterium]|nr:MAG: ATP-binding cassette domain-containing protein [Bacteroidota bacterium]